MKPLLMTVVAGALLVAGCGSGGGEKEGEGRTNQVAGENPLTAPVDYLGAAAAAKKTAVRVVDTASVQKAIQMFGASEGRHPRDLQELVSEGYLPKLPDLPVGMAYEYEAATGQVKAVRR
jgi:outer membrane murein-binding lipoprotein Lpp